ncbi:MAG: DEAD/DEAH box helicase, partial [Bacteroidota bacterium]
MMIEQSIGYKLINRWMQSRNIIPFDFQKSVWQAIDTNQCGIINAPTGCGKTYSVFLGTLIRYINQHPENFTNQKNIGLQLLWITPLRALATDIAKAMQEVVEHIGLPWKIGIRNGDTNSQERIRQKKQTPEILIITPESLHLLLAQKNYPYFFSTLSVIAVDEWHELMGSKRGVQIELALSRLKGINIQLNKEPLSVWGISATIGNLVLAGEVLLSCFASNHHDIRYIKADQKKEIRITSILPDDLEKYPWSGHLGLKLIHKVIPIIKKSSSTLIFINTRGMSERWYQELLNYDPELSGQIALHHGSIEQELRNWVEAALHEKKLKAVVCTASLDLGVDFRPVDTVIQVGSPKGIARFLQRAGRSGHQPDAISQIYFLPTHSLELVESVALQQAAKEGITESKDPQMLCMDVLLQYLNTLAISEGFDPKIILKEIKETYAYRDLDQNEWHAIIHFLLNGGKALKE